MILQNKRTGVLGVLEATTYHGGRPDNIVEVYEMGVGGAVRVLAQYKTLEELLQEWEDYKPIAELVEQAKAEARQNLSGEDLEKCYKALDAWARNTMTTVGWN